MPDNMEEIPMSTPQSIRDRMNVRPTPDDKGLIFTIEVRAYDNGLVTVNGRPTHGQRESRRALAWVGAVKLIAEHLVEFQKVILDRAEEHQTAA
jgi:hypothetical protein